MGRPPTIANLRRWKERDRRRGGGVGGRRDSRGRRSEGRRRRSEGKRSERSNVSETWSGSGSGIERSSGGSGNGKSGGLFGPSRVRGE